LAGERLLCQCKDTDGLPKLSHATFFKLLLVFVIELQQRRSDLQLHEHVAQHLQLVYLHNPRVVLESASRVSAWYIFEARRMYRYWLLMLFSLRGQEHTKGDLLLALCF
jgi:hypothetical protein